jgi:acetoin utilization protein AcuC
MKTVGILYQEELKEYDFGEGHPFRGNRYELFYKFLQQNLPEDDNYRIIKAKPATDEDLLRICHKNYIEFTRGYYEAADFGLSYPGKFTDFHSMDNMPTGKPGKLEEAARLVVGQAKLACQLVQDGKFQKVVSIGGGLHHAKPNYGEGFCLYNDVAFCARYLLQEYKLERVLILDTDAHAGNGTYEYFQEEPRVLFIDLHQDPRGIYPYTGFANQIGSGDGKGFTINIPLPLSAGNDCYKLAFETIVEPVTREFRPQIIICNGGSDPHYLDSLTNLGMTVEGFRMIGAKVRAMAEICDDRVIDLIASGYTRAVLPYCWLALISGLAGFSLKIEKPVRIPDELRQQQPLDRTKEILDEVKSYLKNYWKCLR